MLQTTYTFSTFAHFQVRLYPYILPQHYFHSHIVYPPFFKTPFNNITYAKHFACRTFMRFKNIGFILNFLLMVQDYKIVMLSLLLNALASAHTVPGDGHIEGVKENNVRSKSSILVFEFLPARIAD